MYFSTVFFKCISWGYFYKKHIFGMQACFGPTPLLSSIMYISIVFLCFGPTLLPSLIMDISFVFLNRIFQMYFLSVFLQKTYFWDASLLRSDSVTVFDNGPPGSVWDWTSQLFMIGVHCRCNEIYVLDSLRWLKIMKGLISDQRE